MHLWRIYKYWSFFITQIWVANTRTDKSLVNDNRDRTEPLKKLFFNTCYIHSMKNTQNCEPLSYNGLYFGLYTWLTLYSKIYSAKAAIHGLFPWSLSIYCIHVVSWLPSSPARIKNWYHSKFQLILFTYSPLIPKLCSDKSESGGKWILVSHWLISTI